MDFESLILGMDVGTSSIKVSLMDGRTPKSVYTKVVSTKANVSASHKKGDEQDVIKIFQTMRECLQISEDLMRKVCT